jgi:hypothetical protein
MMALCYVTLKQPVSSSLVVRAKCPGDNRYRFDMILGEMLYIETLELSQYLLTRDCSYCSDRTTS